MLCGLVDPWTADAVVVAGFLARGEGGVVAFFEAEGDTAVPGVSGVVGFGEVDFEGTL